MENSGYGDLSADEDAVLVSEFRRGKVPAFERIFLKFHGAITFFAGQFLDDYEAGKDISSEVFVTLWQRRSDFENIRAIQAFLYVSARNASLNYQRRRKMVLSHQNAVIRSYSDAGDKDAVFKGVFEAEYLRLVYAAIEELPQQVKRVARLSMQGLNTDEISLALDLAPQTVRNTRVRAEQLLRNKLAENPDALALAIALLNIAVLART
jgi:RNA polymerase sigma-70 factor (ECF subfamily)